jgi:hypothetical protein
MTFAMSRFQRPAWVRWLSYGFVVVLAVFELWVFWLMIHPDVSAEYHAYYIERSSTCLPQPVAGNYRLGERLLFTSQGDEATKPVKACGWFGANGEGTPSKGTSSVLDFVIGPQTAPLTLQFAAQAAPEVSAQRVKVFANDVALGQIELTVERTLSLPVPLEALAGRARLRLRFEYPDAKNFDRSGLGSPTQNRAIRLLWLQLG